MSGSPSFAQMSEANSTSTLTPSFVNIPKIGGLCTLEGVNGRQNKAALKSWCPDLPAALQDPLYAGTAASYTDHFARSLAPVSSMWTTRLDVGSKVQPKGHSDEKDPQNFILQTCLAPVTPMLSLQSGGRGPETTAVPIPLMSARGPCSGGAVASKGTQQQKCTPSISPDGFVSQNANGAMASTSDAPPISARGTPRATPRSWRGTNTYASVRSWCRQDFSRRGKELDQTLGDPLAEQVIEEDSPAKLDAAQPALLAQSNARHSSKPTSLSSDSFMSESDFGVVGGADPDASTDGEVSEEHTRTLPKKMGIT